MTAEPIRDWQRGEVVDTPPPTSPPTFELEKDRDADRALWPVLEILDGFFFVVGSALVVWLGWIVLDAGLDSWRVVLGIIVFWVLLAYIGLPRLQQVLTRIYVPDYFIGRAVTDIGVLGDPVNLAADGTEADLHAAMSSAGWVRADELTLRSSWGIVVSSVLRRPYPAAPVSPLFLFGRQQAFAYQQEVDGNASQRHHVRFWPVPDGWTLPGGFRVGWLAAATYDSAVGLSLFTLQVTHRVDADIDVERDYVLDTVRYAEPRATLRVIKDYSAAFTTRNGGGDIVRTDGDLPILDVTALQAPAPEPTVVPGDAVGGAGRHHVPPPSLLAVAAMSVAKATVTAVGVLVALLQGGSRPAHPSTFELVVMGLGAAGIVVLWWFLLKRRGWARIALMAVCAAEAVTQLVDLAGAPQVDLLVLSGTAITVLILIGVSSSDARRWCGSDR